VLLPQAIKALSAKLADNLQLLRQLETDAATAKEYKSAAELDKSAVSLTVRAVRTRAGGRVGGWVGGRVGGWVRRSSACALRASCAHTCTANNALCCPYLFFKMQDTLKDFISAKFGARTPCHPTSTAPECGLRALQKAFRDLCVSLLLSEESCVVLCWLQPFPQKRNGSLRVHFTSPR
jgi:hypothetical protein